MRPFPAHIFISFSALAKPPSSAHLFLQGCRVHDHRLPGRGDDDHPGLRQVRVVPRPLQKQHGRLSTGLHKLWYPVVRDRSTWGKFGAHGEHGDVFLFSNLGAL